MSNETHSRAIQAFPNPYKYKLFIAYCHIQKEGKTVVAKEIIDRFFDGMPKADIERLLSVYQNMTPEQRKNPKFTITKEDVTELKESEGVITTTEISERFNISPKTVYHWKSNGDIECVGKQKHNILFSKTSLAAAIEKKIILE